MSVQFDVPYNRFTEVVKLLEIPVKKGIRTAVNDNFFNQIDTELKAYLLGYLIADGCIEEKSNRILLGCNPADLYVIQLFKTYVCPINKITLRKTKVKLSFMSKHMVQILKDRYKIIGRKTYNYDFDFPFETIPPHLINHFIRGVIDGDGCFSFSKKEGRILRLSIVGTQRYFLQSLINILNKDIKATNYFYQKGNCFTVGLNIKKSDEEKIYNYLYTNSFFFLERKRSKFTFQYRGKLED